jgi:hypothetical protein
MKVGPGNGKRGRSLVLRELTETNAGNSELCQTYSAARQYKLIPRLLSGTRDRVAEAVMRTELSRAERFRWACRGI